MKDTYTQLNGAVIDQWVEEGWEWGQPISHAQYQEAENGNWGVLLTPLKFVPKHWFCEMKGAKVLGLASGGGQQMPVFSALGAQCTVLDYSKRQLDREREVAEREHYKITLVHADMTKPLPFEAESFDLIFHPVSNCYIEDVLHVWKECFRIVKPGGILLSGLDNGLAYAFNDEGTAFQRPLPFNPLIDQKLFEESVSSNSGIQFSHTIEEQIGGQLKAGFQLTDIYQDTDAKGNFHDYNIPLYFATRSLKPNK